jgi:uncharacterized protein (TIGR03067 family)
MEISMNLKQVSMAGVVAFVFSCAPSLEGDGFQGRWELYEMAGDFSFGLPAHTLDDVHILTFNGESFTFTVNEKTGKKVNGTFKCRPNDTPKQIWLTFEGRKIIAIYALEGGKLSLCIGTDDANPPASFGGGPESRPAFLKFRREKQSRK